jgi:hypothetical protein
MDTPCLQPLEHRNQHLNLPLTKPTCCLSFHKAGVEVLPATLAAGLKFSWPTYKSGLRVMIHTHLTSGSTWAFSEIFRWEVRTALTYS